MPTDNIVKLFYANIHAHVCNNVATGKLVASTQSTVRCHEEIAESLLSSKWLPMPRPAGGT